MFIQNLKIRLLLCVQNIGLFQQQLASHISNTKPQGCRKCGIEQRARNSRIMYTVTQIRELGNKVFNNLYSYPDQDDVTIKHKIRIICKVHGEYQQVLSDHLKSHKCNQCSYDLRGSVKRKHIDTFVQEANQLFKGLYDYSKFVYVNNKTHGIVMCNTCSNEFLVRPDQHLFKELGCPFCNFKSSSMNIYSKALKKGISYQDYPCTLYAVELSNDSEKFIKIGVTTNTVYARFKDCPYQVRSIHQVKTNLMNSLEKERELLNYFKEFKIQPLLDFSGKTECFDIQILDLIENCPLG